jgi:teichuronic acid biosynthesis glycosyltransferase TuaC
VLQQPPTKPRVVGQDPPLWPYDATPDDVTPDGFWQVARVEKLPRKPQCIKSQRPAHGFGCACVGEPIAMTRPIRTLLFSTLYPSSERPLHGIFVETRLRELLKSGAVDTRVVAPVPWFFSGDPRWGDWGAMVRTPHSETRHGIEVLHPRYPVVPKIGMTIAPLLLALAVRPTIARLIDEGFDFDLIDAHYYYPDGVAAAMLARHFGKPFCVTARGTDLNLIPQYRLPKAMMQWTASHAAASIGVCGALVDVLRQWGVDPKALHVMRNGVDLHRFAPMPQAAARGRLGLSASPLLLSVGHLVERKGHHIAIRALAELRQLHPQAQLLIAGEGTERASLEKLIADLQLGQHVRLLGSVPNTELASWYSAADVLILASSREGWANVLLEAMACGTPVVATKIWGTPEVVAHEGVGRLVADRTGPAFAAAIHALLAQAPDRAGVRRYAEGFSWEETSQRQLALFAQMTAAVATPSESAKHA